MDGKAKLKELAAFLRKMNATQEWVPVRDLLRWFDAKRRGSEIVREIRHGLRSAGLRSEPDFTTAYIDDGVFLVLRETSAPSKESKKTPPQPDEASVTRSIGTLEAATNLHRVAPEDSLKVAVTKMHLEQRSELAVVHGSKSPRGIITWATIGEALYAKKTAKQVSDCTKEVPAVPRDEPLLETIAMIAREGAVLVQDKDKTVIGLVTTRDITYEFTALAKPFLLLGEIEEQVRRLCRPLPLATLREARDPRDKRPVNAVHDLSLGELVRLMEPPKTWRTLRLDADQPQVLKLLREVCDIRNGVMHFEPDPPTPEEIAKLEAAERFLRKL